MTAHDLDALIAAADLTDRTDRLMLADELEAAGRDEEASVLRGGREAAAVSDAIVAYADPVRRTELGRPNHCPSDGLPIVLREWYDHERGPVLCVWDRSDNSRSWWIWENWDGTLCPRNEDVPDGGGTPIRVV